MDDNSKEFHNAKLHLQEKMREWLGANQEFYSKCQGQNSICLEGLIAR